jgi:hypothetical protein
MSIEKLFVTAVDVPVSTGSDRCVESPPGTRAMDENSSSKVAICLLHDANTLHANLSSLSLERASVSALSFGLKSALRSGLSPRSGFVRKP